MKRNHLYLIIIIATFIFVKCGKAKIEGGDRKSAAAPASKSKATLKKSQLEHIYQDQVLQSHSLLVGPKVTILDSAALKEIFLPVFGTDPRGNGWNYFAAEERRMLGSIEVTLNDKEANLRPMEEISQDYIQTLRYFVTDSCDNLITKEMSVTDTSAQKLYRKQVPSAEQISEFMSMLFGFTPLNGGIHKGALRYHEVFSKFVATPEAPKNDQELKDRLKNAYLLLCVAVATDPRVYLR